MPTVFANMRGVAHKGSGGMSIVFPDVCKTPSPGGPVPIPYVNVASDGDLAKGTKSVTHVTVRSDIMATLRYLSNMSLLKNTKSFPALKKRR